MEEAGQVGLVALNMGRWVLVAEEEWPLSKVSVRAVEEPGRQREAPLQAEVAEVGIQSFFYDLLERKPRSRRLPEALEEARAEVVLPGVDV